MRPKDYINKKAQEEALKAFGATQLNSNQESSAYFVGKINASRTKITDPTGKEYDLIFTGNPKEYELAQRLSDNQAVVNAQNNKTINVDGNGKEGFLIYPQVTGPHQANPNRSRYRIDVDNISEYETFGFLTYYPSKVMAFDLQTQKIVEILDVEEVMNFVLPFGSETTGLVFIKADFKNRNLIIGTFEYTEILSNTRNVVYSNPPPYEELVVTGSALPCPNTFSGFVFVRESCTAVPATNGESPYIMPALYTCYKVFKNFKFKYEDGVLQFTYDEVISVDNLKLYDLGEPPINNSFGSGAIEILIPDPRFSYATQYEIFNLFTDPGVVLLKDKVLFIQQYRSISGATGFQNFIHSPFGPGEIDCGDGIIYGTSGCPGYTGFYLLIFPNIPPGSGQNAQFTATFPPNTYNMVFCTVGHTGTNRQIGYCLDPFPGKTGWAYPMFLSGQNFIVEENGEEFYVYYVGTQSLVGFSEFTFFRLSSTNIEAMQETSWSFVPFPGISPNSYVAFNDERAYSFIEVENADGILNNPNKVFVVGNTIPPACISYRNKLFFVIFTGTRESPILTVYKAKFSGNVQQGTDKAALVITPYFDAIPLPTTEGLLGSIVYCLK